MKQLHAKVANVTGGAAGFGEGIVRLFIEQGARVVLADLDVAKGEALARELGAATDRARFVRCDVPVGADVAALLSRASDVAAAALYLASDAAAFISGVELPVDGARTV